MDAAKQPRGTEKVRSRYRGLTFLVVIFVILIAALMAVGVYLSSQINQDTGHLNAAGKLRALTQTISQDLYNLKLSYGEDPTLPQVAYTLKSLKESKTEFESLLKALSEGGEIQVVQARMHDHNTPAEAQQKTEAVYMSALVDADSQKHLKTITDLWSPLSRQIDTYLKDAQSLHADSTSLDMAVATARDINVSLLETSGLVIGNLGVESALKAAQLRWTQIVGIAMVIVFFTIFVFYFIRRLGESDAEVEAARSETTEIFNTVNTGLFLLDQDMNIGNQYSKELESLMGQRQLSGRNLLDLLGSKLNDKDLETTHGFVGQLYNPKVKERLISGLNPLVRIPISVSDLYTGENRIRYLDFKFNRVYHNKEISKVLVNVSDETDAVLLEKKIAAEREQNDMQLEMLATLLKSDQTMINDFVRNTKRRTQEINNILKRPGESQSDLREKATAIFREAHSLKGESSALNLHGFTLAAENLENELKNIQGLPALSGENFLGLAVSLERLMQLTQIIEDLLGRLGGGLQQVAARVAPNAKPISSGVQGYYTNFVADLAKRNNKEVKLTTSGIDRIADDTLRNNVKDISLQLLRNAVVHGIEAPQVRLEKSKPAEGALHLELADQGSHYTLSLQDDGAGINYDAIRAKAVKLGMYTADQAAALGQKQLLGLLFHSGFSTLDTVSEDAGRGVGLDIIKERIMSMGGKINVSTAPDEYTRFVFTLPKQPKA